jgi:hypothetical protein
MCIQNVEQKKMEGEAHPPSSVSLFVKRKVPLFLREIIEILQKRRPLFLSIRQYLRDMSGIGKPENEMSRKNTFSIQIFAIDCLKFEKMEKFICGGSRPPNGSF